MAAPECRAELRPARHRAASHNGARYAFVRSKTPSHVALSGAPPRCLQAEKSGARTRHTFRPSGNPSGWNRKRSVPLVLLLVNPGVVGGASAAAKRYAVRKGDVRNFSHCGLRQVRGGDLLYFLHRLEGAQKGGWRFSMGTIPKANPKCRNYNKTRPH